MQLIRQIPVHFYDFLNEEVKNLPYLEEGLDCSNCSFSDYLPSLKCCTFEPFIPNFVAYQMRDRLKDSSIELPIGILPSLSFQQEFKNDKKRKFGNEASWLCPYFDKENSNCGIWTLRGSSCVSFFCKSKRGESGKVFWSKLQDYLSAIEVYWAAELLSQLGFPQDIIMDQLNYLDFDGEKLELDQEEYNHLWWKYAGNSDLFYQVLSEKNETFDAKEKYSIVYKKTRTQASGLA